MSIGGLVLFIVAILATYLAAVAIAERLGHIDRSLVPDFVLPLVPIAAAYLMAHYFTSFLITGQFIIPLVSDPFGRGWDLFGTGDFAPNLAIVSPETVWYAQVAALVVGHVAGLAIAHDRAVAVFKGRLTALEAQLPMLGLMVLYTLGGMWLLTRRLAHAMLSLIAHGGIAGAIVEATIALAVVGVLVAVWLHERRRGDEPGIEEDGSYDDRGS